MTELALPAVRLTLAALPLMLLGCSDYEVIFPNKDAGPGFDSGGPAIDSEPPADDSAPTEGCDGEDNDLDGLVDEGFPDTDGDGVVDCLDQSCDPAPFAEGGAEITFDPWDVVVEWSYGRGGDGVYSAVVAGQLTDDNGDGVTDGLDIPELIVVLDESGTVAAVSGDTGAELWTLPGIFGHMTPAVADVDGDGLTEVIVFRDDGVILCLDGRGQVKWRTEASVGSFFAPGMTVGDLDADGLPEVIAYSRVLSGEDGSVEASLLPTPGFTGWTVPVIADIDADGDMEILLGHSALSHEGEVHWSVPVSGAYGYSGQQWTPLQADSDPEAELLFIQGANSSDLEMTLFEHDGTELFTVLPAAGHAAPPCVADFDGDGASEIVLPLGFALNLYELDGTEVWSVYASDTSGAAGCSAFDFDGDGAAEIVYTGSSFRVLDGTTGDTLFEDWAYYSGTTMEYPTIGDFDGDGSVEIAIGQNGDTAGGVLVYGHRDSYFTGAGRSWGTHDFTGHNVEEDGHIPANATPSWQQDNLFRARPSDGVNHGVPDLEPLAGDLCVASCEDGVAFQSWGVANHGAGAVVAGALVSIYAMEETGERLLSTLSLPAIPSGQQLAIETLTLPPEAFSVGVAIRVDDDGTGAGVVTEGDESNNTLLISGGLCD